MSSVGFSFANVYVMRKKQEQKLKIMEEEGREKNNEGATGLKAKIKPGSCSSRKITKIYPKGTSSSNSTE
ncbi:hypothetical protein FRX31_023427 [Thalictrum thalictroides]|uniref:Uncharacterized protein n=1 Tax=Thalictrum thalictroides TaxID=46969 RepID=A0A7J6VQX2_THATH|nr:hypothetical protein FRX31_023427 [Thalictrum thalictroides]